MINLHVLFYARRHLDPGRERTLPNHSRLNVYFYVSSSSKRPNVRIHVLAMCMFVNVLRYFGLNVFYVLYIDVVLRSSTYWHVGEDLAAARKEVPGGSSAISLAQGGRGTEVRHRTQNADMLVESNVVLRLSIYIIR